MSKSKIDVRDLRAKERFFIDDDYIDKGMAKVCGVHATAVYLVLCRHADKHQKAYPSLESIAEKLGTSLSSVQRGVQSLKEHRIIYIDRKGKKLTNRYYLLDKSVWSNRPVTASEWSERPVSLVTQTSHTGQIDQSIERKHNSKETQKKGTSSKELVVRQKGPNPIVSELMEHFKSRSPILDDSERTNRRYAYLLYGKLANMMGGDGNDVINAAKRVIDSAVDDRFHAKNATSFRYLYNNLVKIIRANQLQQSKIIKVR